MTTSTPTTSTPTSNPTPIPPPPCDDNCYLWGITWQKLAIASTFVGVGVLMTYFMMLIFGLIAMILTRYFKKPDWVVLFKRGMFRWTVELARFGFFWAGYTFMSLPANWTVVLDRIVPLPFVFCLFFFVDAAAETASAIGKIEFNRGITSRDASVSSEFSTRATGFSEMLRVIKYVSFILVFFVLILVEGGNVVVFLNDAKLLGLIVAFAFQPWLKNIAGGMSLFYDRKYVLGNEIRFAGLDGVVKDMTLRSTTLERDDNSLCFVPNGRLLEQPVVNFSRRKQDVVQIRIKLDTTTPPDKIRTLIREVDISLQTLNTDLTSHAVSQWQASQKREGVDSFTQTQESRKFLVGLEGHFEFCVITQAVRKPGLPKSVADRASQALASDVLLAITEVMQSCGVQRRDQKSSIDPDGKTETNSLLSKDMTNDDDGDMTTMLIAFYST